MAASLRFKSVDLDRVGLPVLHSLEWEVGVGERWVVLGPNGSGKTTTFELSSGYLHPTRGSLEILGERLGTVDVRRLRQRIGLTSTALVKKIVPTITAADAVVSGKAGALEPWWGDYGDDDYARAVGLLGRAGFAQVALRLFGQLSDGERQQVMLARALMADPDLLLLDEPFAGLDIGGRERLVGYLARLAADPEHTTTVMITHHLEEIPAGFTHALLLRDGSVVAAGELGATLTAPLLSETFGLQLLPEFDGARWTCRAA